MNRIDRLQATFTSFFERKAASPLVQIFKGVVLLCFSQCASLYARAQILRGDQGTAYAASALARRVLNQNVSVINHIPDQVVEPKSLFNLQVNTIFSNVNHATTTASLEDQNPLPSWLSYYPSVYAAADLTNDYNSITILGDFAYATSMEGAGLDIIDISSPEKPILVATAPTGSGTNDMAIEGHFGYTVGSGYALQILDLSEPANPEIISQFVLQDWGQFLAVRGPLAYVTLGFSGFQIVNISNPYFPQSVGSCALQGLAEGVSVAGDNAYVANALLGLQIIDIRNPLNPVLQGTYSTSDAWDVVAVNQLAYVTAGNWFEIVNVTNATAPSLVGSYYDEGMVTVNLKVVGNLAYVAEAFKGGVSVIDISKPNNPTLVETIQVPSLGSDVAIKGDKIYLVAEGVPDFFVLYPSHPCGIFWGTPSDEDHGTSTVIVRATDAQQNSVFDQFDLYVSSPPILLSNIADQSIIPGKSVNLFIDNNIFYDQNLNPLSLSASLQGAPLPSWLSLINYPILLGHYPLGGYLDVKENYAYIVDGNGLHIFDISSSSNPTLAGELPLMLNLLYHKVDVEGDLAYVAGGDSEFYIIDIKNRASPFLVGNYTTPGSAIGVTVRDNIAFVSCYTSGLLILNVTIPSDITLLSHYYTPIADLPSPPPVLTEMVTLSGDLAFVTDLFSGLQILDITNVQNPKFLGAYYPSSNTYNYYYPYPDSYQTVVEGNLAYLGSLASMGIIDITDPTHPTLSGEFSYSRALEPGGLDVVGDLLYTASGYWQIFDVSNSSNPFIVGSSTVASDIRVMNALAYVMTPLEFQIFDISKWRFTGTPAPQDAGNYEIEVTAKNPAGLSTSNSFTLRVEGPPQLVKPVGNQVGTVGTPLTFFIDQTCFQDPNGDIISYSASLSNGSPLPPWLSFSPTGIFTGIPGSADAELYTIQVTALDGIVLPNASSIFDLTVIDVLGRQTTRVEGQFYYSLDNAIVKNPQGPVTYQATQSNGAALPAWLRFDTKSATFTGSPQEVDKGELTILVTGNDGVQPPVTVSFTLLVNENSAPVVENQISNQIANVNEGFRLIVPDNTFSDANGDSLTLTASLLGGDPLPHWLSLVGNTFHGTPGRSDTGDFSPAIVPIQVTASDGQLQASTAFSISVEGKSNAAIAVSVIGTLSSALGIGWSGYKNRAYFYNWHDKEKYQKPMQKVTVGANYSYQLQVPLKEVVLVQAFMGKSVHFDIKKPRKLKQWLTYDAPLPGALLLPNWLEYDCSNNMLISKQPPREEDIGIYLIRAFAADSVIKSEFKLVVGKGEDDASVTQTSEEDGARHRQKTIFPLGTIDV